MRVSLSLTRKCHERNINGFNKCHFLPTEKNNLSFIETSALDSTNVEEAFKNILTGRDLFYGGCFGLGKVSLLISFKSVLISIVGICLVLVSWFISC